MTPEEFAIELKKMTEAFIGKYPDKTGILFFIEAIEDLVERWLEEIND